MVELRGGVVLLAPRLPAVEGDVGAAIVSLDHALGIVRRDPEVVAVAVRDRDGLERLAAIGGAIEARVQDVDRVRVLRIGEDARVVPGALAELAFIVRARPRGAGVVGTKDAAGIRFDDRPHTSRIGRRHGDPDVAEEAARQPRVPRDLRPVLPAIGALEQTAAGPA